MKIETTPIEHIRPYAKNNRTHPDQQIERIAQSIREFGFNQPIVIDEENTVLVGHGRLLAAQRLQLATVPVVRVAGLKEAQKRGYRILDNKLQNDSEWELGNLEEELAGLIELGFPMESWGLDKLHSLFPEADPEIVEDDGGPLVGEVETVIKLGDVIQLGRHRVLCGDSRGAIPELLSGKMADLVVTDPPYGVDYIGGTKDPRRESYRSGGVVENDDLGDQGIYELIKTVLDACSNNSVPGCAAYIASAGGTPLPLFIMATASNFRFRHSLVWVKNAFVFSRCDYHYRHELILYGWKDDGAHYFCDKRNLDTVLEHDRGDRKIAHPTSKPLALFAGFISNSSKAGQIVLDPFLGSGTTLVAADQLNRICYGMEISPGYCEVIIQRYQRHCVSAGKPFECLVNGEKYEPVSTV